MSLLFRINKETKRKHLLSLGWIISVPLGMETQQRSTPLLPVCSLTGRWSTSVAGSHAAFENWTKLFLISSCNEFSPFWYSD